jgi:hypothetical protein
MRLAPNDEINRSIWTESSSFQRRILEETRNPPRLEHSNGLVKSCRVIVALGTIAEYGVLKAVQPLAREDFAVVLVGASRTCLLLFS